MSWQKKKIIGSYTSVFWLILRGSDGQECPKVSSPSNGNSLCPLVNTFKHNNEDGQ